MTRWKSRRASVSLGPAIGLLVGLAACSMSPATSGRLLGYGTLGVSSYMGSERDDRLQSELDRCRQVPRPGNPTQTQGLEAACRQLNRTLRNQPGNSVPPTSEPAP